MSADLLREAAARVRERAEAATPGPWECMVLGSEGYAVLGNRPAESRLRSRVRVARLGWEEWEVDKANAAYIAAMHPLVGLALADWLDGVRLETEFGADGLSIVRHVSSMRERDHALAVARAVLGRDA